MLLDTLSSASSMDFAVIGEADEFCFGERKENISFWIEKLHRDIASSPCVLEKWRAVQECTRKLVVTALCA
ncbi:MAG: hypothetical protein AUK48_02710 [Oscillatoriales cyanobacterium CG2_30_44_21]|nr:MAG: hypothetical protein AUK48_02710 [Oscillatoriales cyanobacterium CG2_30_44_21]